MDVQKGITPLLDQVDLNAIDAYLETLYESDATINVARKMASINLKTSQVRKLENLVVSTRRFSEIINFIKNQTGKDIKNQLWPQFADTLLNQLNELEIKSQEIGQNDFTKIMEIKKHLARGWVKQIVAHYLFTKVMEGKEGEDEL